MNSSGISSTDTLPADVVLGPSGQPQAGRSVVRSASFPKRRVLLISYAFPPTGGGGVQRAVKFAKYLPSYGWQPTVLTAANPSVPLRDHDLAGELDPGTKIVRAGSWEPGYGVKQQLTDTGRRGPAMIRNMVRQVGMQLLQPDPQILWNRSAMREAIRILRAQPHDVIFVTGPPFSSFLLGSKLKQRFGIPLVLDFRDEWLLVSQYMENHQLRGLAYWRQYAMMQKTLQAANAVVATTQASAAELASQCRKAASAATVSCIYNGFDPDDLGDLPNTPATSSKLRIAYTGTLWKLTDISPLVSALESLAQTAADRAARVELTVAGRRTPQQDSVLARLRGTAVSVVRLDYLPHSQALKLAASADLLLLLLADQPGVERVVPAKLFEYLALQKPILAIGPEGETNRLLRQHGQAQIFQPAEIDRIARWLETQLGQRSGYTTSPVVTSSRSAPRTLLTQFSRPILASELADLFQHCVASD